MKFLSLLALVAFASAAPTSEPGNDLVERFSGGCGVKQASFYGDAQVAAAANQACTLFRSGKVVGSNKYPHKFNNGEKFKFHGVAGPYQEFPIIKTGAIYNGGTCVTPSTILLFSGSFLLDYSFFSSFTFLN